MNWPWFLKPLDARLSDMCGGNIAVILAFSCGFAEIFAAIGFHHVRGRVGRTRSRRRGRGRRLVRGRRRRARFRSGRMRLRRGGMAMLRIGERRRARETRRRRGANDGPCEIHVVYSRRRRSKPHARHGSA